MSLTDYEKYHLHDHVCTKSDVYDKSYIDTQIPKKIFYRGHCKHNNHGTVRFYPNTDINVSINVSQSNNDFVCDLNDNKKLLIKNKGLYILTFSDGYKCSQDCNFEMKMDKISHNVNSKYIQISLKNTNNSWKTMSFTTVMEVEDDTTIQSELHNSGILDGLTYSYITIYRLTE